ncbi:hypothetical protein [Microbulbifer variabilis]|uniref:hypothetical protein n=1 Tax=Microbulbifer variabilis TaxID=266805 RepID=UPI001CFD7237|nr:hypothetical protein [Microbulbifer variabilis]
MLRPIIDKNEYGDPDRLSFDVILYIGDKVEHIPGGAIESFQARLELFGFQGCLSFSYDSDLREDTLIASFSNETLIAISISFSPTLKFGEDVKPVTLKGIVTEKSVVERRSDALHGQPIINRFYTMNFSDPAQVLWKQHFPCELYTNISMRKVVEKQLVPGLTLECNHNNLNKVLPMIALGLCKTHAYHYQSTGSFHNINFYDFLMSYIESIYGVWLYDYENNSYIISDKKPEPEKTEKFLPDEVTTLRSYWPSSPRHNLQLLNGIVKGVDKKTFSLPTAQKGIHQDILYREPLKKNFDDIKRIDEKRFKNHGGELHGAFTQWPLETYYPGCAFSVDAEHWGTNALYTNQRYRCYRIDISAIQTEGSKRETEIAANGTFSLEYSFYAEYSESPKLHMPEYNSSAGSFFVEGEIVSAVGSDKDLTYDLQTNNETGQMEYQVHIPLFNQTIRVLFEADNANPHMFFPLYRDTRVLLAIDLYRAVIVRVLDWGRHSRLTPDTQGNHLLFGKNDKDQTSIKHIYKQDKPELQIKRTKGKDTEMLQMSEGTLVLQTCEE